MVVATWAALFAAVATGGHLFTVAVAGWRLRRPGLPRYATGPEPAVSVVVPVCGIDNFAAETLASSLRLDYPDYEVVFCVARPGDPVVGLVTRLIAAHPGVPARLLVGDDGISANPKLNNCVKGWDAARHSWIVLADSNLLLPPDYLRRLLARWRADTGVVCSMPIGSRPDNFWGKLECAFLNTLQARYQYVSESLGFGFAQGKTLLFRRSLVEAGGGIRALALEVAEDAATTKLVRRAGRHVHLVDAPFEQPLGRRGIAEVWCRQLRWARLRRATFPLLFVPELFVGSAFPALAAALAAPHFGLDSGLAAGALVGLWIGAEFALAQRAGWHRSAALALAILLRDLLLPILWLAALWGNEFVWRGTSMSVADIPNAPAQPDPAAPPAPEVTQIP